MEISVLFWVVIISIVIFLAISIIVVHNTLEEKKNEVRHFIFAVISIILALIGILFAISDEYLSQFDNKYSTIKKFEKQKKEGVCFTELVGKRSNTNPEYIFVLDVSGSTNIRSNVRVNEDIDYMINEVNSSGRMGTSRNNFKIRFENGHRVIPFQELLRVRLLYSLTQLQEINTIFPDSVQFSIVLFADHCRIFTPDAFYSLDKKIQLAFDEVNNVQFNDKNTNFVELFKKISERCYKQGGEKKELNKNQFVTKNYIVLFFSDYEHDVQGQDNDWAKKEIEKELKRMSEANACFKFYTVMDNYTEQSSKITVNDMIYDVNIGKKNSSDSILYTPLQNCDLLHLGDVFDYAITTTDPIPFFYSNGIYEDTMSTKLTFDKELQLFFCLGKYNKDSRQEFRLTQHGLEKVHRLSNSMKCKITTRNNDTCNIIISGYIPAPYQSPDIVITDKGKNLHYIIPVVFFKEYPFSGKLVLCLILVAIMAGLYFIRKAGGSKNNSSNDDVQEFTNKL